VPDGAAAPSRHIAWRRHLTSIGLAAVLLVSTDLGARVLATNDDARFPLLGEDILRQGHWLRPELNGVVYYNKPPLLAWLIALASWSIGHVTPLTAALPSAAAGIATALIVYGLGRDLFGADAGRLAALVAMTTQGVFLHARSPLPDMLMTCLITASMWMLLQITRGRRGPWWAGFYGLAGAAFWAKGPAGLLPIAVAIVYIVATRSERRWSLRLPSGLALVGGLVGLWGLVGTLSDGSAVGQAIITDHLLWYRPALPTVDTLTAPLRHTLSVLFPWVIVAPFAITHAVRVMRGRGIERDGVHVLLVWVAVTLALVGLSHQQRVRYYVPVVPPMALLIGWWFSRVVSKRWTIAAIPWRALATAAGLLITAAAAPIAVDTHWWPHLRAALPGSPLESLALVGLLGTITGALIHGVRRDRLRQAFIMMWSASALLLVAGYHWDLQRYNTMYDYPRVVAQMRPWLHDSHLATAWGVPALPLSFYFDQPVAGVESARELWSVAGQDRRSVAIVTDVALAKMDERGQLEVLARDRLASADIALVRYASPAMASDPAMIESPLTAASQSRVSLRERWRAVTVTGIAATGSRAQYHFASEWADRVWEVASVLLALIGLAARVYTVGVTAPVASGAPGMRDGQDALETTGPYSIVRHPLYCANVIIGIGFSLFPHVWVIPPLVLVLGAMHYRGKARWVESGLRERFGATFDGWAARVPGIIPRVSGYVRARRPFDVKAALGREHPRVAAVLLVPVLVDFLESLWETHHAVFDPLWTTVAILGLALFVLRGVFPRVGSLIPPG
jgi:4-amino-4-deoxy-L-arabinose transferase-like glycosyltransferase/protein-S-isoprenylcysteine O-methyltransferase Ste14